MRVLSGGAMPAEDESAVAGTGERGLDGAEDDEELAQLTAEHALTQRMQAHVRSVSPDHAFPLPTPNPATNEEVVHVDAWAAKMQAARARVARLRQAEQESAARDQPQPTRPQAHAAAVRADPAATTAQGGQPSSAGAAAAAQQQQQQQQQREPPPEAAGVASAELVRIGMHA
jgi:hypothetical protein